MTDEIPGWFAPEEAEALVRHAKACPGPWVEIGSYCGLSTHHLGEAAQEVGVTVFAVDPHKGNPEMWAGRECHHPEVWAREHGSLSVLLDTLADLDSVVPVVGSSAQFSETGCRPGFVFIDGNHDYEGVSDDFHRWSKLLVEGGTLCLHDADAHAPLQVRDEAVRDGWTCVEQVRSLAVLAR